MADERDTARGEEQLVQGSDDVHRGIEVRDEWSCRRRSSRAYTRRAIRGPPAPGAQPRREAMALPALRPTVCISAYTALPTCAVRPTSFMVSYDQTRRRSRVPRARTTRQDRRRPHQAAQ